MKNSCFAIVCLLVFCVDCHGQSGLNSRAKYLRADISTDDKNRPLSEKALYYPLSLFPRIDYVGDVKEDSSDVLAYSVYSRPINSTETDTQRFYKRINNLECDTFLVKWFSKHLFALNEPLLFNRPTNSEAYRFLWLRTFHNPVVITIEKLGDDYHLSWKISGGAGGYDPGEIVVDRRRQIKKSDWNEFQALLNSLDFWHQPSMDFGMGMTDGARWILEGATPDKYYVMQRQSPREEVIFHRTCRFLISLTKLKLKPKDIY